MALDDGQQKWVDQFTGKAATAAVKGPMTSDQLAICFRAVREQEEIQDQELKEALIANAHKALNPHKARMQKAFRIQLEQEGKLISTMGMGGDHTKAFDVEDLHKVTAGASGQSLAEAQNAMSVLEEVRTGLENKKTLHTKIKGTELIKEEVALFTVGEIMDEVYEPLRREMVLPESLIPKRLSRTQQMIEESNDYYLEELKDYVEEDPTVGNLETVSSVADVASQITQLVAKAVPDVEAIGKAGELADAVLKMGLEGTKAVVKGDGSAGAQSFVSNVSDVVVIIIKTATGNSDLADLVQLGMKGAAGATIGILGPLLEKDEPDIEALLENLAGLITNGFGVASSQQENKQTKAIIKTVGECIASAFEAAAVVKKQELVQKLKDQKWGEVAKLLANAAATAGGKAMKMEREIKESEKPEVDESTLSSGDKEKLAEEAEKEKALGEAIDKSWEEGGKAIQELAELKEGLKELKKSATKAKKEDATKELKDVEKQLEVEQKEYMLSLERLSDENPNLNELKSIAKLMEQIKRDRMIMQTAVAIGSGGVAVAGAFFGPLAAAGKLVKFMSSVAAATQRAIDLRKWVDANKEAISAASPYRTSIENFVKNQQEQFSHYTIKAALNAIQFGAEAVGTAVPYAKVVSAAAAVSESIEELTFKFFQERALKAAWNLTKQALDNPDNRKLGLIARRQNATLAKYSIAYGAVIQKDVIAVSSMGKCGLDRETLANKDSSVAAVKEYLELLYPDDGKVLGEYTPKGWDKSLPAPALNVKTWVLTYTTAKENLDFTGANPREIVTSLKRVEKVTDISSLAKEKEFDAHISDLTILAAGFRSFQPKSKAGGAVKEMQPIVNHFVDLVDVVLAEVTEARSLKFDAHSL